MKILDSVFLKIYTMSYYDAILLLLAFSLFICILHAVTKRKTVFTVFLLIWLATVLSETLFFRTHGSYRCDWRIFGSYVDVFSVVGSRELLRSNFMNAVLFYPFGLLSAVLLENKIKPIFSLLISFAASLVLSSAIELLQFQLSLGNAQADDILHNAVGAVIGTAVFIIFKHMYDKKQKP